jgi:hypothetical protein
MFRHALLSTITFPALLASTMALAQVTPNPTQAPAQPRPQLSAPEGAPEAIRDLYAAGGQAQRIGDMHGLDSWVIVPPTSAAGTPGLLPGWLTPDGKHIILGRMFNGRGEDASSQILTEFINQRIAASGGSTTSIAGVSVGPAQQGAQQASRPAGQTASMPTTPAAPEAAATPGGASSRAAVLMAAVQQSAIHLGNSQTRATLILDANCGWSARTWTAIKPFVERGDIGLDVVMVGILNPTSMAKGTAINGSSNPMEALSYNFDNFGRGQGGPGAAPADAAAAVPPEVAQRAQNATQIFAQSGFRGVPVLLWRTADGRTAEYEGHAANMQSMINSITGRTTTGDASGGAPALTPAASTENGSRGSTCG